jgi:hypothetical protein
MGWTLLHEGNHTQAAQHFQESLRIDSNNEWARAGIVEALKSKHLLYRLVLRYFLWVAAIPERIQLFLFVGVIVMLQLMIQLPSGGPLLVIGLLLAMVYMLFVFTIWTASPLFNLVLRCSRFGRMALTDEQRWDTNWMAMFLALDAILISAPLVTQFRMPDLIRYVLLLIAVGVALNVPREGKRKLAMGITIGLFATAYLYWYRYYFNSGLPFPPTESALIEALMDEGNLPLRRQCLEFIQGQNRLGAIVSWGTAGMTWLASAFHSKG